MRPDGRLRAKAPPAGRSASSAKTGDRKPPQARARRGTIPRLGQEGSRGWSIKRGGPAALLSFRRFAFQPPIGAQIPGWGGLRPVAVFEPGPAPFHPSVRTSGCSNSGGHWPQRQSVASWAPTVLVRWQSLCFGPALQAFGPGLGSPALRRSAKSWATNGPFSGVARREFSFSGLPPRLTSSFAVLISRPPTLRPWPSREGREFPSSGPPPPRLTSPS